MPPRLHVDCGGRPITLSLTEQEAALPLAELLSRRNLPLNTRCGGRGICNGCEVVVHAGQMATRAGECTSAPARIKACQHRITSAEATIELPARSQLTHAPAVVSEFQLGVSWARAPLTSARYGAAVDVGTTTVALALCDLSTGAVVAEASAFNEQIRFGEDVVTRIQLCTVDKSAVRNLQRAVAEDTIQQLLDKAAARAGVDRRDIGAMTVAGNTTMLHLLAGGDPSPLGTHPFKPVFLEARAYAPGALCLSFGDTSAQVHLLPSCAAYVGADLTAGLVATGMLYAERPTLLVDVGTNGEIIARANGHTLGCATAAGPAFEGAGLSSGTRAIHGAIERVRIEAPPFRLATSVIGNAVRPVGVCGSAYIDLLWEGRRAGLLQPTGRFSADFITASSTHFEAADFGQRLRLHPAGTNGPIWFSEADVARLLQAKAAIAAGIETLLALLTVDARDIDTLYLAGGFGLHLSVEHAIGCGLLPGFRAEQIKVVGNTSLGGAFLALNDSGLYETMNTAAAAVETIELNLQPGFEDAYIDHLALP